MDVTLRKATLEDLELLIQMRFDYIAAEGTALSKDMQMQIEMQLRDYFKRNLDTEWFIAIVAEINGEAVASAYLAVREKPANIGNPYGKTGTVLNVLTYPQFRRQGISTKVLIRLIEEAKLLGVCALDLSATKDGKPLYESLGFTVSKKYTEMHRLL